MAVNVLSSSVAIIFSACFRTSAVDRFNWSISACRLLGYRLLTGDPGLRCLLTLYEKILNCYIFQSKSMRNYICAILLTNCYGNTTIYNTGICHGHAFFQNGAAFPDGLFGYRFYFIRFWF